MRITKKFIGEMLDTLSSMDGHVVVYITFNPDTYSNVQYHIIKGSWDKSYGGRNYYVLADSDAKGIIKWARDLAKGSKSKQKIIDEVHNNYTYQIDNWVLYLKSNG